MVKPIFELIRPIAVDILGEQPDRCQGVLQRAAEYYKQPLSKLELKDTLPKLYEAADTDEPIGIWVDNVPKPGDVAGCLPVRKKKWRSI